MCYGSIPALHEVTIEVGRGEIVCLLGGNASGKSTVMKTVVGSLRPTRGRLLYEDRDISSWPISKRVNDGIAIVPEARRVFPLLTVVENLRMGAFTRKDREAISEDLERQLELFPQLRERKNQRAGTLSGGEQQMLAMARALMAKPRFLCMDEPSMGLAPIMVRQQFETIQRINRMGVTIFMVEQNATMALAIANRGYVLQSGRVVLKGKAEELLENSQMKRAYLGI